MQYSVEVVTLCSSDCLVQESPLEEAQQFFRWLLQTSAYCARTNAERMFFPKSSQTAQDGSSCHRASLLAPSTYHHFLPSTASSTLIETSSSPYPMKIQAHRIQARDRTRSLPYLRPSISEEDGDLPYKPRIEDDTLQHLLLNELARGRPLEVANAIEENRVNGVNGGGMRDILVVLGLSLMILVGKHLVMVFLVSIQEDKHGDGL
ncbi:hypothetical protein PM082_019418 [Marasmius tenuissimus]|nr:hypothetical protein PM082_019418 [Marasmius tenuissimus]